MARTAAARALSRPDVSLGRRFDVRLASAADDEEVRRLLREHPLPGDVALTFEREPDSAIAAAIEGDVHQTMVARETRWTARSRRSRAGPSGTCSSTAGPPGSAILASSAPTCAAIAWRALLDEGFAFCRTLHEQGNVAAYLTAIVEDNHAARRLLCGLRSSGRSAFRSSWGAGDAGDPARRPTIAQAAPASRSAGDRSSSCRTSWRVSAQRPPLSVHAALDGSKICSSAGERPASSRAIFSSRSPVDAWPAVPRCGISADSSRSIVRGYSQRLARWRGVVNLAGPWIGVPALPAVGHPLEFVYLSHVAVDDDRADVTAALVSEARRQLAGRRESHGHGLRRRKPDAAAAAARRPSSHVSQRAVSGLLARRTARRGLHRRAGCHIRR